MIRFGSVVAVAIGLVVSLAAAGQTVSARADEIVIGVPSWSSANATAHVLETILEDRFGVDVALKETSNAEIFAGMDDGSIQIHPEVWLPNYKALHDEYVLRRKSVVMSPRGVPASQGLCVTQTTYDDDGIHTIQDLADPEKAKVFDTNGDGRGEIWIGAPGWNSTKVEQIRAHDYGYDKTMQLLQAEETVGLAAVDAAVATGKPMAFYCYEPHHVFELHDLVYLDEPAHDPRKWQIVDPEADGDWLEKSKAGVAWPPSFLHIFYAKALEDSHPEIASFLKSVNLDVDTVSQMTYALVVERRDPAEFAREWVDGHGERISGWIEDAE